MCKPQTCPVCRSTSSECAECGAEAPLGTVAECADCQAPHVCCGCGLTVQRELQGILKAANDDT